MNCTDLMDNLHLRCHPVPLVGRADPGFLIETPYTLLDGSCVNLYVIPEAEPVVKLTDDGELMMQLRAAGHFLDSPNFPAWLYRRASAEGLTLAPTGAIYGRFNVRELHAGYAAFGHVVAGIREWEREQAGLTEDDESLVDAVEACLRTWRPESSIRRNVPVIGASRREHTFDLEWDGRLVDAVQPIAQATAHKLRKILDVKNGYDERRTLIVVDDRLDKVGALAESQIYSTVTDVMMFTRLAAKGERPGLHH